MSTHTHTSRCASTWLIASSLSLLLLAPSAGAQLSGPPPKSPPGTSLGNGPALGGAGGRADGLRPGQRQQGLPDIDPPGAWTTLPDMPDELAEVAAAAIGNTIYITGFGSAETITLDLTTLTWADDLAAERPLEGQHQSAEVWGGKLYLIGGFKNGSSGEVQIYDPLTNDWSLGAPMPWLGGSVCTAVIDGKIYAAGGVVYNNAYTSDECAVYDPATDEWTSLAPMPHGRNHAATASDGDRMWVFGGRGPGSGDTNTVANGFDHVQVYDPETDTWESSDDSGSDLEPLPIGRGGTGKAVFHGGEFYVLGGETNNGPGAEAGDVYDRVDVYDPQTNTWRQEPDMPTARHGIFPVVVGKRLFVLGGGTDSGSSESDVAEVLHLK